ncbi:Virus attachment protein p12 family [Humidesulfovibrio mexicanus]|jgi:hypothetical protein|uniref:Virus attachment protein p12 family n=1 Tax=Humidesulfovibrio mexicanus TaxID=147047 RepID=A0A238YYI8_9BACT|nr:FeoB-associated Cys-rich membrane protein [Humidesulfovibrio mexicanus]SNR76052.1 Virus attachment protein p12 family [Humidesulfovibrio mexicanus]
MWQDILVYVIVGVAAAMVLWRFSRKFTGKSQGCDGGCSGCASCPSAGAQGQKDKNGLKMSNRPGGGCCG